MKRILLFVFGTRPEAIKLAPLVLEALASKKFQVKVAVTAQHREMLDDVLQVFGIVPDFDLNVMSPGQSLQQVTAKIVSDLEVIFEDVQPNVVLVHGDTVSSSAAAFAAYLKGIDVAHVEAGLRTFDLWSPWPEEGNRKIVSALSSLHFAPTKTAAENLYKEGVCKTRITITGNTVIDALLHVSNKFEQKLDLPEGLKKKFYGFIENKNFVLITCHRRENFGQGVINVCSAIERLASRYRDIHFVYPVHPNPNIHGPVMEMLSNIDNIHLIEPQSYLEFVFLMKKCLFILTDSGGIQEEAPSLQKPVLVLRDVTERPEAVAAGTVELVGTEAARIFDAAVKLLEDDSHYKKMSQRANPYGDGDASKYIINALLNFN